jgi:hypothetical protein
MTNGYHPPREVSEHPKRQAGAENAGRRPRAHKSPTAGPKSASSAQETANDSGRLPKQA